MNEEILDDFLEQNDLKKSLAQERKWLCLAILTGTLLDTVLACIPVVNKSLSIIVTNLAIILISSCYLIFSSVFWSQKSLIKGYLTPKST